MEVLVTLLVAGVGGIAFVVRLFHRLDKRVQAMEQYRETHDEQDAAAHKRLEAGSAEVLRELREFRAESTRQHETLAGRVDETAQEGREGRSRLHEKVDQVTADVQRLVGFHEASARRAE